MDFTLNITASPELLSVLNRIAGVAEALLVKPPKTFILDVITESTNSGDNQEQIQATSNQTVQTNAQAATYPIQNAVMQQQTVQSQTPENVMPAYNQFGAVPVGAVQTQQQAMTQPQNPIVPTSINTYTMEQLAVAATQLMDAGHRNELVGLLNSFGVQALTALPQEQYGAFATQLRVLGAKI